MKSRMLALLVAIVALLPSAPAEAYVGPGDDRQKTTATGWWFYTGVTQAWISDFVARNNARITDLHVETFGSPWRYSVVLVSNSGSYASSWWWYTNVTVDRANQLAAQNQARIVKAQVYDTPYGRRATVVMVGNTGTYGEAWWWYIGTTKTLMDKAIANSARIVSLNSMGNGYYIATFARNTGNDATGWWWYVNATVSTISSRLTTNHARLVDLDRNPDGTYNVVMYSNPGVSWYWWVDQTPTALRDKAIQYKQRIIDFTTYWRNGTKLAAGLMVSNTGTTAAPAPAPAAVPRAPGETTAPAATGTPSAGGATAGPAGALLPSDDPDPFAAEQTDQPVAPSAAASAEPDRDSASPSPTAATRAEPDGGDFPVVPVGVGLAALAAAVGVGAVVARRRA
ncbi:MAG TPA: hypothetical protein VF519_13610 [Mycobacteriales bacterium]